MSELKGVGRNALNHSLQNCLKKYCRENGSVPPSSSCYDKQRGFPLFPLQLSLKIFFKGHIYKTWAEFFHRLLEHILLVLFLQLKIFLWIFKHCGVCSLKSVFQAPDMKYVWLEYGFRLSPQEFCSASATNFFFLYLMSCITSKCISGWYGSSIQLFFFTYISRLEKSCKISFVRKSLPSSSTF